MSEIADAAEEMGANLNMKQVRFCREYLIDRSATKAYIRAGYSEGGAGQSAANLLKKTEIAALIARFEKDRALRTQTDADQVLSQLARLGFSDIRKICDANGSLLRMEELDDDTAAAIQSVKVTKRLSGEVDEDGRPEYEDVVEYKLADKKAPLELIGKHLELFVDRAKVEVTDDSTMVEKMRRARERLESGVTATGEAQGPDIQEPLNPDEGEAPE